MRNIKHSLVFGTVFLLSIGFISSLQSTDLKEEGIENYKVPPYPWKSCFDMGAPKQSAKGHQILHAKSTDRHYTKDPEAVEFVESHLSQAKQLTSDAAVLRFASDSVPEDLQEKGVYLELGFGLPRNANLVAGLNPQTTVYAYYSPAGQEEEWEKEPGRIIKKGALAPLKPDYIPPTSCLNIEYYKGDLEQVLQAFKKDILKDRKIALLVMDLNTYTPTKTALDLLTPHLKQGTVLFFDEFYNSNSSSYKKNEYKAFQEFITASGYPYKYLAFNVNHEQVAIRLKKRE